MSQGQCASVTLTIGFVDDSTRCVSCGERADLHQPDLDVPERLLATCPKCGLWALLLEPSDGGKALAMPLPDVGGVAGRPG
jgi:hypothetical protein